MKDENKRREEERAVERVLEISDRYPDGGMPKELLEAIKPLNGEQLLRVSTELMRRGSAQIGEGEKSRRDIKKRKD